MLNKIQQSLGLTGRGTITTTNLGPAEDPNTSVTYAYWRTDKAKEDGYSLELVSRESEHILEETDLDTLESQTFSGVDTLLKAMRRNLKRIPNNRFLGVRIGEEY